MQFIQQDIFDVDLSGATVVTLYLLPEVNLRLRPKLLRELKAGSRVVSHNYGMGDWKEEEVAEFHIDGETHYATVWVMPPPISTSESDAPAAH
ncbi:MAG: SAM-dependent methyltransferase [Chthoniobacter sp.]|nr:SAM-dependent methyltransferase [Chthoniobacter sp.]